MTREPPPAESEEGLPDKRNEFTITAPWIARFLLTAAIGALVGFAASTVLAPSFRAPAAGWLMIGAGALAATLLSIRKVHGWHVSTFADGTIAGIAAAPVYVVLMFVGAALQPGAYITFKTIGQGLLALPFSLAAVPITVPCGWLAGFAYHVLLSAAERARAKDEDIAS